jgi:hypothetical protein
MGRAAADTDVDGDDKMDADNDGELLTAIGRGLDGGGGQTGGD